MGEGIEMRLSFWPSGMIGAKARVLDMIVGPEDLAALCTNPKAHCPMGCFSCPFEGKKCEELTVEDWQTFFFDKEETKEKSN